MGTIITTENTPVRRTGTEYHLIINSMYHTRPRIRYSGCFFLWLLFDDVVYSSESYCDADTVWLVIFPRNLSCFSWGKSHLRKLHFWCPCAVRRNCIQSVHRYDTSYIYDILPPTEVCQQVRLRWLSLKPFRKLRCFISTDAWTRQSSRPRSEATISSNVLGTRLLSSPYWNNKVRLLPLPVNNSRHSLS